MSGGKLRGAVFSVDGFLVRIKAPTDVINVRDYFNRKGCYAFVVQASVDAIGKFLGASVQAVGCTHDSLAFKLSSFYQKLEAGKLARPTGISGLESFFGLGDDAYANREFLITPWPGRNLSTVKDSYNYWQSKCRAASVECAFGRLVARWGCLWRKLSVSTFKVPSLIMALMKLHNLCDHDSDKRVTISSRDISHFIRNGDMPQVFYNDDSTLTGEQLSRQRQARRVGPKGSVNESSRQAVTDHLRRIGATRPPHSRYRA